MPQSSMLPVICIMNFRWIVRDEIGYLASCLNYMASEIARSEDNQKSL